MRNLTFFFLFVFSNVLCQFYNSPNELVNFAKPNSYLIDSLLFNQIQTYRESNKIITYNRNEGVFDICQIINHNKINYGYNFDNPFMFNAKRMYDTQKNITDYSPIMWEVYQSKISNGRHYFDSLKNYSTYQFIYRSYYIGEYDIENNNFYDNKLYKNYFVYLVKSSKPFEKYTYSERINLFDITTEIIPNKFNGITYKELVDELFNYVKNAPKLKHFITSSMIDVECNSDSECNQFGLAIDFFEGKIFITIANFNLF